MLEFRDDDHSYWFDSERVPSVTTVIEDAAQAFAGLSDQVLLPAQWRGTAVHRATELLDMECLDWGSVDDDLHGYLHSWERFKQVSCLEIDFIEERIYHPTYRYAGTLDRTGSLKWDGRRRKAVIDLKTGAAARGTAVQTAAYQEALKKRGETYNLRLGVHLKADGSDPDVREYKSKQDMRVFLAMLKVYNWKRNIK